MRYRYYKFTIEDMAVAVGKSEAGVRKDVARKRFDPCDLTSIARYIMIHKLEQESKDGYV